MRWNIKLNILKTYVEHFTGFMRFYQVCFEKSVVIQNAILSEKERQGEILIEMLQPYELLTKYASENTSLVIAYVPILISLKNILKLVLRKLKY